MNWTKVRRTAKDDVTLAALREVEPTSAMRLSAHIAEPTVDAGWPYYRHGSDGYQATLLSLKRLEALGLVGRDRIAGISGSDIWRSALPPTHIDEPVWSET